MNMPLRSAAADSNLLNYNDFISKIAERFDATVADLSHSKMRGTAYNSYSVGDNLHPTDTGNDIMTELLADTLMDVYLK